MRLGITPGDPLGIGPEIIADAVSSLNNPDIEIVLYSPDDVWDEYFSGLVSSFVTRVRTPTAEFSRPVHRVPSAWGGAVAMRALHRAVEDARKGDILAVVTGPVSKQSMALGGWTYPGQTELLAELTGCGEYAMMLAHGEYRAVPATRHIPVRSVSGALTMDGIFRLGVLINEELGRFLGRMPRMVVCGLNPHAGDNGLVGDEEISIIGPAIEMIREAGIMVQGPISAEEAFITWGTSSDVVIAMYHDQAAIPVKMKGLHRAVNVTLGLPIIRTSPGHGTAYSIAGTGKANSGSMKEAIAVAVRFAVTKGML